jgi:hypothetical protein
MSSRETYRIDSNASRKSRCHYGLSIVRTLVFPHPEITRLIADIKYSLDTAFEPDTGEKGVALLESRAILHAIKDRRGTVDRRMLAETEEKLIAEMQINNLGQTTTDVLVNQRKPLKMLGLHKDVLVISLLPDMRLGADRGAIESFMDQNFPCDTDLSQRAKRFDPHITLGKVKPQLLDRGNIVEFEADPIGYLDSPPLDATPMDRLIHSAQPGIQIPQEVSLNGLRIKVEDY